MSVSSVLRKTDIFTVAEKIGQYVRQGQDVTTIYPVWNAWSLPLSDWYIFSISSGYFIQCNVEPWNPGSRVQNGLRVGIVKRYMRA